MTAEELGGLETGLGTQSGHWLTLRELITDWLTVRNGPMPSQYAIDSVFKRLAEQVK